MLKTISISFVCRWIKNGREMCEGRLYTQSPPLTTGGRENSDWFIIKEQLKMLFEKFLHISPEEICSPSASGRNQYFNCYSGFSCDPIHRRLNEKVIFDALEWNLCGKFVISMCVCERIDAIWYKAGVKLLNRCHLMQALSHLIRSKQGAARLNYLHLKRSWITNEDPIATKLFNHKQALDDDSFPRWSRKREKVT